jgi:xanthine phosphoribosyltransferase
MAALLQSDGTIIASEIARARASRGRRFPLHCRQQASEPQRMAHNPYEDEIIISWVELHRDTRYLSQVLHEKGPWKGIIAVTRGGLVPAALIARELDIRLVDTVCVTSYDSGELGAAAQLQGEVKVLKGSIAGDGEGWLLIDDLVDTGRTAQIVRKLLPKAHFAALYAKPAGRPIVDTFVKEFKQTKWIHFPWDIEYRFATPIKEGGRVASGPG